jgi:hypothetical protein
VRGMPAKFGNIFLPRFSCFMYVVLVVQYSIQVSRAIQVSHEGYSDRGVGHHDGGQFHSDDNVCQHSHAYAVGPANM